jgi:hypothetical protein
MKFVPNADSTPDVVLDWLHDEGWSVDHSHREGVWSVVATRGSQHIKVIGKTLEEAWYLATEQARHQNTAT